MEESRERAIQLVGVAVVAVLFFVNGIPNYTHGEIRVIPDRYKTVETSTTTPLCGHRRLAGQFQGAVTGTS